MNHSDTQPAPKDDGPDERADHARGLMHPENPPPEDFLASLTDELRNALGALRNAVRVVHYVADGDPRLDRVYGLLDRQVKQITRLLEDLLDVSHLSRGGIQLARERVDLGDVIRRAADLAGPQLSVRRLSLQLDAPPKGAWLTGDAVRLTQILANLFDNAARRVRETGVIWLRCRREDGEVIVDVGGAPKLESLSRRAENRGALGMRLAGRLAELHGGRLEVHTGDAEDLHFVVHLPTARSVEAHSHSAASVQTPRVSAATAHRILVIDDNVDAADSLALLLSLAGHAVFTAHDGLEALDLARLHRPDVVFIDIGLPGMDGFEVARKLRLLDGLGSALFVAITGFDQGNVRQRSFDAGMNGHLVKPVDPSRLEALLASLPPPRVPEPEAGKSRSAAGSPV